jgi:hypothetical protein
MTYLGVLLVMLFGLLIAIAVKRGASGMPIVILTVTVFVAVPAAILGVLIWGFSSTPEDAREGAVLLLGSIIGGGGIAYACLSRLKKS